MKRRIILMVVLLLGGLALWRVTSAPIPVDFVTPYLNEMLSRNQGGWSLNAGETVLAWRGWSKLLDLNLRDVEVRDRQGNRVVKLPVVSLGLSLSALVHGKIALSRVEILHAELQVDRDESGRVAMQSGTTSGSQEVADFVLAIVHRLLTPHDPEYPLSFLDVVRVEADRATWADRKRKLVLTAAPVTVDLRRSDSGVHCEVTLQLDGGEDAASSGPRLQISAEAKQTVEDVTAPDNRHIDLEGGGFGVSLVARAQNIRAANLGRYWPKQVAGEARSWVTENVRSGNVREAVLNIAFDRKGGQTTFKTLEGTLAYAGLRIEYLGDWPQAESVTGGGTFDRQGLRFDVASGLVGGVRVGASTVEISGLDSDKERIDIRAAVAGPSNAIADLVASHSPELVALLALDPKTRLDEGTVDLGIGFPLYDRLTFADVTLKAQADLPGLQTRNPYIKGVVPTRVDLETRQGGEGSVGLDLDLSKAHMAVPFLGWRKERGVGGRASVVLDLNDLQPMEARDLKIEAGTLQARGRLRFQDEGRRWELLELEDVSVGRTKLSRVTVKESGDGLRVELGRGEVDVEAMRNASDDGERSGDGNSAAAKVVLVAPQLRRVSFAADRYLEDVSVHAEHDQRGWRNVEVSGKTSGKGGGEFGLTLKSTSGDQQQLAVHAVDSGSLLRALGVTNEVRGGRLNVTGQASGGGATPLRAHVEMRDYAVLRSSLLTRLLTLASGRGFGKFATDDAIDFDYLGGDITFADGRATAQRFRTHGPAMGITSEGWVDIEQGNMDLKGAIVPAYTANRVLGKIPVLGSLLSGDGKQGFWAIRYRMSGNPEDPKMEVDTLKSLTPAFLRELFGAIDASKEP